MFDDVVDDDLLDEAEVLVGNILDDDELELVESDVMIELEVYDIYDIDDDEEVGLDIIIKRVDVIDEEIEDRYDVMPLIVVDEVDDDIELIEFDDDDL